MRLDERLIPRGEYCYDSLGCCPYWDRRLPKTKEEHRICEEENKNKVVYCRYLKKSEAELDLLWDQVKGCGKNTYDYDMRHRIVRKADGKFSVREVYYEDGKIVSIEPLYFHMHGYNSPEQLTKEMGIILEDIQAGEIIDESEVVDESI
jgi:hypothetical protein